MICPYCKIEVLKEPKRTFKCKGCGEQVYVVKDHLNPDNYRLGTENANRIYQEQKSVIKSLIGLNIVTGKNHEPENMFNSKPIKNFEVSIENIAERFGNSEDPYGVYIDICNEAFGYSGAC